MRAITRTSEHLGAALEAFSKAPVLPPPGRTPTPRRVADAKAEAAIEIQLKQMAAQLSALHALSGSPALQPPSAVVSCRQWAHDFDQELDTYQCFFDDTAQVRGDAAWALDLFSSFDRSGLVCGGGAELAVGREDWGALVDEVFGDVLDERYGTEEEELYWDASGVDLTIGGKEVEYVASEEDKMEMEVEEIAEDAVDVLQVLAEGYTAWFLGCKSSSASSTSLLIWVIAVAQEWNEACMGPGSEIEWSVVQLVKSQYAVPGQSSDALPNRARLGTVF